MVANDNLLVLLDILYLSSSHEFFPLIPLPFHLSFQTPDSLLIHASATIISHLDSSPACMPEAKLTRFLPALPIVRDAPVRRPTSSRLYFPSTLSAFWQILLKISRHIRLANSAAAEKSFLPLPSPPLRNSTSIRIAD